MSLQPLLTELDTINILKLAIVLSIVQLPIYCTDSVAYRSCYYFPHRSASLST